MWPVWVTSGTVDPAYRVSGAHYVASQPTFIPILGRRCHPISRKVALKHVVQGRAGRPGLDQADRVVGEGGLEPPTSEV